MKGLSFVAACVLFVAYTETVAAECEVCQKFVEDFETKLEKKKRKKVQYIDDQLGKFCRGQVKPWDKMCYYLGVETKKGQGAAGGFKREMTGMLQRGVPAKSICKRLASKDMQICEIQMPVDVGNVKSEGGGLDMAALKKMRVKQLKNILNERGHGCDGCLEKNDYLKKIEEVLKDEL